VTGIALGYPHRLGQISRARRGDDRRLLRSDRRPGALQIQTMDDEGFDLLAAALGYTDYQRPDALE
jgi:hypothetical protein